MNIYLKYIFFAHALALEKAYLYSFEHLPRGPNARATCSMFRRAYLEKNSKYRSEKWVCHYQCAKRFIQKKNFTTSTRLIVYIKTGHNIWLGQDFQRKYMNRYGFPIYWIYEWGEGCFGNLSGTSVPKTIGRAPPPVHYWLRQLGYEKLIQKDKI